MVSAIFSTHGARRPSVYTLLSNGILSESVHTAVDLTRTLYIIDLLWDEVTISAEGSKVESPKHSEALAQTITQNREGQ